MDQYPISGAMRTKIMQQFMVNLAGKDIPIVFKGGNLVMLLLQNNGVSPGIIRETVDIDADWTYGLPDMYDMQILMDEAAKEIDENISITATRTYDVHRAAQFVAVYQNKEIFSLDVSVKVNDYYNVYTIDKGSFYGQSLEKTVADKIAVTASRLIYRRVKDFYDLYPLSFIKGLNYRDILHIISVTRDEPLGNFSCLLAKNDSLEKAYMALGSIESKPAFQIVYSRVCHFVASFANRVKENGVWNGSTWIKY